MSESTSSRAPSTAFLDLTRGVAALWVATAHAVMWGGNAIPDMLEPKKAVDLFMVVSGFLMFYTIDKATDREPPGRWSTWRSFYIRRFLRIAPAYYVALILIVSAWPLVGPGIAQLQAMNPGKWANDHVYGPQFQSLGLRSLALHIAFLFGLFPDLSFSDGLPDWSLSLEMQFYAIFPALYLLARRHFAFTCAVLALACLVFTRQYMAGVERGSLPAFDEPSLILFNLPKFLVGALLYEAGRRHSLALLALGAAILVAACRWYGVSGLFLFGLIGCAAWAWWRGLPDWAERGVRSRAVKLLAVTSYSLYLFHTIVIFTIGAPLLSFARSIGAPLWAGQSALVVAVLGISYPLAWIVFRTVEEGGTDAAKALTHPARPLAPPMA